MDLKSIKIKILIFLIHDSIVVYEVFVGSLHQKIIQNLDKVTNSVHSLEIAQYYISNLNIVLK